MQHNVPSLRDKDLSAAENRIGFNGGFVSLHFCAAQVQFEAAEDRGEASASKLLGLQARLSAAEDVVEIKLAVEVRTGRRLKDERTLSLQGIPDQHGAHSNDQQRPEIAEAEVNHAPVIQLEKNAHQHHERAPVPVAGLAREQLGGAKGNKKHGPERELVPRGECTNLVEQQEHADGDYHQASRHGSADPVSFGSHESSPCSCLR